MLKPIYKENVKKLNLFVELIKKFIKKIIGKQKRGKKRFNLNKVICGILFYLKTGCQWRLLPDIFGKWRTVYGWYSRFCKLNCFEKLWHKIIQYASSNNILQLKHLLVDGSLAISLSNIEIKRKNPRMKNKNCVNRLVLTDKQGLPITFLLSLGTANDTKFLIPLIDKARGLINLDKKFIAHADKGFDSSSNRWQIILRNGYPEIPIRNQGFETEYSKTKDPIRPNIERTFSWVNSFKAIRTIATKLLSNLYENIFFVFSIITSRVFKFKDLKNLVQQC